MPGPFNATDFGFNVPGIVGASATGTTLSTATVLVTQGTVFTTVAAGGLALLPSATASDVMLAVFNQGANTLSVAPQTGGFINFSSTPALILPGGVSFFFCFDPPLGSGRNWFAFDGGNGGGGGGMARVALVGATANGSSVAIPALGVIQSVLITETAGHPVTVTVGTTNGASDVLQATLIPSRGVVPIGLYGLLNVAFAQPTPLFFSSSAWGGASINVVVWYVV